MTDPKELPPLPPLHPVAEWNADAIREYAIAYAQAAVAQALAEERELLDWLANSPACELTRSIIHKCPAVKLPQSFLQRLGMTAQIMPLKGCTDEQAQALVDQLNRGEGADGVLGMAWWNGLTDEDRSFWMKVSLGTSPADAWAYFKRCGADGVDLPSGGQRNG